MIRKQVENLQGLVLTPEELDFIKPIIIKSLEMNTRVNLMNGAGDTLEIIMNGAGDTLHGYCFTGNLSSKPYLDPYGLDDELL